VRWIEQNPEWEYGALSADRLAGGAECDATCVRAHKRWKHWAAGPVAGERKKRGFWQEVASGLAMHDKHGAHLGVYMCVPCKATSLVAWALYIAFRWLHKLHIYKTGVPSLFARSWTCSLILRFTLCTHGCSRLPSRGHNDMREARCWNLERLTWACKWQDFVFVLGRMNAPRWSSRQPRGVSVLAQSHHHRPWGLSWKQGMSGRRAICLTAPWASCPPCHLSPRPWAQPPGPAPITSAHKELGMMHIRSCVKAVINKPLHHCRYTWLHPKYIIFM